LENLKIPTTTTKTTTQTTSLNRPTGKSIYDQGPEKDHPLEVGGLSTNYGDDVRKARYKAVTNPKVINPLTFENETDRHAAILSRADRIINSPVFKAKSPKNQSAVLSNYYDKYVAPGYKMNGLTPPDKDLWLREVPKLSNRKALTADYLFPTSSYKQALDAFAGAANTLGGITYGGIKFSKAASFGLLGLGNFFHLTDDYDTVKLGMNVEERANKAIDYISHDMLDRDNFWLQSHPSKHWTDKLDTLAGETIVQLPFFKAIGAAREFAVGSASSILPQAGRIANMTSWLGRSKAGQVVAKSLTDGADGLIGSVLQGASGPEAISNAASWMGFGLATEGPIKGISAVSDMIIKKATASTLAMGGEQLQGAITGQAAHELTEMILGHSPNGDEIKLHPRNTKAGSISIAGQHFEYKNLAEQQELVTKAIQAHHESDPVHAKLMQAEKLTLSQVSRKLYDKPYQNLSKAQRASVLQERVRLTQEAVSEAPIHLPSLAKAHIDSQLQNDIKENPAFGEWVQKLEQASGLKVSSVLQETEAEQVKALTGIQNSQATAEKLGKPTKPQLSETREEEPRQFYQFKVNSLSYLKKNASTLSAEIKTMDEPREFSHALQEEMGAGLIKFEDEKHALLWANQFRSQLPRAFQNRLLDELHERNPGETIKQWDTQSKNLSIHMEELAHTGRLFIQGRVFRSTQVENWLSKTKWQKQLRGEVETIELDQIKKKLYRYPKLQKNAISLTKKLQTARAKAENADTYKWVSDEIRGQKTVADWKNLFGGSK
jgi:hypothetical protein